MQFLKFSDFILSQRHRFNKISKTLFEGISLASLQVFNFLIAQSSTLDLGIMS